MIALTHLVFGLAVGKIFDLRIGTVMIFAVLPDIDRIFLFAYPLVRNGISHSVVLGIGITVLAYVVSQRLSTAKSSVAGYLSHLGLDLLCFRGIAVLYPATGFYSVGVFSETSFLGNLSVLSVSLMLIVFESHTEVLDWIKKFS
ncbi:metal-dependent hydrolase [Candidatus Nanohalococcus occultus]|uniref:metal-dependent hydrolase n=1 Tax=Candidatus Nanohalococcus occultus TaxID=2978047 RepID=UPI0039E137DC